MSLLGEEGGVVEVGEQLRPPHQHVVHSGEVGPGHVHHGAQQVEADRRKSIIAGAYKAKRYV